MLSQLAVKKIALIIGIPLLVYGLLQYMRYPVVLQAGSPSNNFVSAVQPIQVALPVQQPDYQTPQVVEVTESTVKVTGTTTTIESTFTGGSDSTTTAFATEEVADINTLTFSEAAKLRMRLTLGRNLYEYVDDRTVKPFIDGFAIYRVAPQYNAGTCTVTKSMTTVLANVFCYLYDSDHFIKRNSTITGPFFAENTCNRRNEYSTLEEARKGTSSEISPIFVVRDPTERFLSGFVDKCVNEVRPGLCFDCNGNMECFLIKFRALLRIIQKDKKADAYFLPESESFYELLHFVPQTWFCEMLDNFESHHFVKYGASGEEQRRMKEDIVAYLRDNQVPEEKVTFILDGMDESKRTKHATLNSPQRDDYQKQLFESPILYAMLENLYKPDYELFGFEKPSEIRRRQIEDKQ